MSHHSPNARRAFAVEVVDRLRSAGYHALWAGGCVRDELLGKLPSDFDVATSATPDQVQALFGPRRTIPVGASFGVVSVLGPHDAGQLDVATFRSDAGYSDGRHPDSVTFSNAEHDAQRRDFTINGLFFDPLAEEVIDYVGGLEDLRKGVIRAIGDPQARIAEDKLRMLRAVRFSANLGFSLDAETLAAVQQNAHELVIVAAERIAAEMRKMLTHPNRVRAIRLLQLSGLVSVVFPELEALHAGEEFGADEAKDAIASPVPIDDAVRSSPWKRTLAVLGRLHHPSFPAALAALLHEISRDCLQAARIAGQVAERLKLTTDERERAQHALRHEAEIRRARSLPWPRIQRLLIAHGVDDVLTLAAAVAEVAGESPDDIAFCRHKLVQPPAILNPPPLLNGDDLIAMQIPRGPIFRLLLDAARDAQLEEKITSPEQARELARALWERKSSGAKK